MCTGNPGWLLLLVAFATTTACSSPKSNPSDSAKSASPSASAAPGQPPKGPPPATREGSAIVRAPQNDVLFVADEDHSALRIVPIPFAEDTKVTTVSLPGRPAQVIASRDRVLVTVRDLPEGGGGLVILKRDGSVGLNETTRVALPADAWGLALAPDESFVVVSSAWSGRVSVVDLGTAKVKATLEVGREPRGVAILPDGKRAYVSHLVGTAITRIDGLDSPAPTAARLDLPASPLRTAAGTKPGASLGYAVVLSPNGERVFFPRHAVGALGDWYGAAAVDVWLSNADKPLVPPPGQGLRKVSIELLGQFDGTSDGLITTGASAFVQPRAAIYRPIARTLLVASEGTDLLVELDALMTDPTVGFIRSYPMAQRENKFYNVATSGGAPSGIALSRDEDFAFVYCRTTDDVVAVRLIQGDGRYTAVPPTLVRLVSDAPPDESLALGRSLFYNATDEVTSGGLACSGCHPDGRDDGHVWHEASFTTDNPDKPTVANFLASVKTITGPLSVSPSMHPTGGYGCGSLGAFDPVAVDGAPDNPRALGHPRQTPMIAGRVSAHGPYGWHAESPDLKSRIVAGFGLHRWRTGPGAPENLQARGLHLARFLREGLVPPARTDRALTEEEQRGKAIFESGTTQCTRCHVPASGFTDRIAVPLGKAPPRPGFVKEENAAFKTPSLMYVGGTPPYFHDGRFESLEALIEQNADTMGRTAQLTADEKKALVAYLKTL